MEKSDILERACRISGTHPSRVKGCYVFGSRVYGTASEKSDWDIILVANSSSYEVEYNDELFNVHVLTPSIFEKYVKDNHIKAAEWLYAPDWAIVKPYPIEMEYDPAKFRHSVSHVSSNAWVKAKKKIEQGDYYIGIKSMFHSLRVIKFGIQFAENRKIDFESAKWIWDDIQTKTWEWEELKYKYIGLQHSYLTKFRKLAPKNVK
jgi:predicted nucleotidyltransferase